jgi:nucleoside-diphosphate-sugar epimerase
VAGLWLQQGKEVHAVTRSPQRAESFAAKGLKPILAEVTQPASLRHLPKVETLLYAVGYDRQAGPSIDEVYVTGLRNVLDHLHQPARVIYIRTTGVYGPGGDGGWVDETSPCQPTRPGGMASLAAEQLLAGHPHGTDRVVLRMAGLYGPGRLPLAAPVRAGQPIPAQPDAYLNLIHIEDAARVVDLAARAEQPADCYCVSDGQPVVRREFYAELARLLKAPPPTFATTNPAEATSRRGSGDKRISNARLRAELPLALLYPSYQAGLAAICAADAER